MKEYFELILNTYLKDNNKKTNINATYHDSIKKYIPSEISKLINSDFFIIKGSYGNGYKAKVPWISIFNKSVTNSAKHGIYICYLFRSDMSGFYLTINQGITYFKETYGKLQYEYANKVSKYFSDKVSDLDFKKDYIDLKVEKNELGYGYENLSVLAKFYEKGNFTNEELIFDFIKVLDIYNEICDSMGNLSYDEVIDNVLSYQENTTMPLYDANSLIEEKLLEVAGSDEIEIVTMKQIDLPNVKKNTYSLLEKKSIKKIDYISKAKKSSSIGILGERLVLLAEQEKLKKLGREDLINKIHWVSEQDDSKGYDIESFDVDDNGKEYRIFIEVKTTESNEKNVFYISYNELDVMNKLGDKYYIYRVCNANKDPIFYKINGNDFFTKFKIKANSYLVDFI